MNDSGFFGINGNILPNAHDMFIDKVRPMIVKEEAPIAGIGDAGDAAIYGAVTGGVIVLGALSFLWGKYVGSFAVEYISGTKLNNKQKNAIGIASLLII